MSTTHYPNFNENELDWIETAAVLRQDANVDDLISSFLILFPERATHDGLSSDEIQEKLTSRFNDILYRKKREYTIRIQRKREELNQIFTDTLSVLNPLSQLAHFEQVFTDPKGKASDKLKAIEESGKIKNQLATPPPGEQAKLDAEERKFIETSYYYTQDKVLESQKSNLSVILHRKQFQPIFDSLPKDLQDEITNMEEKQGYLPLMEIAEYVQKEGHLEKANVISEIYRKDLLDEIPNLVVGPLTWKILTLGIQSISMDEVIALIKECVDELNKWRQEYLL